MSNTNKIRELNDAFRTTFAGGKVLITQGVNALSPEIQANIMQAVRTFSDFTADNDPHNEHDFGSFEIDGHKFFWKIEYYDTTMVAGSEDPADPAQTTRVLTIMLASEY